MAVLTEAHVSALLDGVLKPKDYFELILDSLGEEQTQQEFLDIIEVLVNLDENIHSSLTVIYLEYFSNAALRQQQQDQQQQQQPSKRRYKDSSFYEERYNSDLSSIGFKNVISASGGDASTTTSLSQQEVGAVGIDDDDDDGDSIYIIDDEELEDEIEDQSELAGSYNNRPSEATSANLPKSNVATDSGRGVAMAKLQQQQDSARRNQNAMGAGNWIGGSLVRKPKSRGKADTPQAREKSKASGGYQGDDEDFDEYWPTTYAMKTGMDFKAAASKSNSETNAEFGNVLNQFKLIDLEPCAEPEDPGCFGIDVLGNDINVPVIVDTEKTVTKKKRKKKSPDVVGFVPPGLAAREDTGSKQEAKPIIYWLRKDLRLHDNEALVTAANKNMPVIPVFIWNDAEENGQKEIAAAGGATKVWLNEALKTLQRDYEEKLDSQIVFRKAVNSCLEELLKLVNESGANSVIFTNVYEPWLSQRDDQIEAELKRRNVSVQRVDNFCLYNPKLVSVSGVGLRGLGSVSHFMTCCKRNEASSTSAGVAPLPPPSRLVAPRKWPKSARLEELDLAKMPRRRDGTIIDWAAPIRASWNFSEDGGYRNLQLFLRDNVGNYNDESGRCDLPNTSQISPYLHFGQISPRTVLSECYHLRKRSPKYLRKLAWRDLAYWLLWLYPSLPYEPLRPAYRKQRWSGDKGHLKAWQKGNTGYPLVDAAMRQLWQTGWCNNYARHVAASFLIAYLHIHWLEGYLWYQDTLVDADVAINAMMWQNGGMSGPDHWNFVMHPVQAAFTCDPRGDFVRKYIPELRHLPDEFIHQPWKAPKSVLKRAEVNLGVNYPHRIVDELEERREQSLKDVVECRLKGGRNFIDPKTGCDLIPAPSLLMEQRGLASKKKDDKRTIALFPVITRKEFKFKTLDPDSKVNPFDTVLKGYVSRQRDEHIARENQVHFQARTIHETVNDTRASRKRIAPNSRRKKKAEESKQNQV